MPDISVLMADPIARVASVGIVVWAAIELTMSPFESAKRFRPMVAVLLSVGLMVAMALAGMAGEFDSPAQSVIGGVLYGLTSAIGAKAGNDRIYNAVRPSGNTQPNR